MIGRDGAAEGRRALASLLAALGMLALGAARGDRRGAGRRVRHRRATRTTGSSAVRGRMRVGSCAPLGGCPGRRARQSRRTTGRRPGTGRSSASPNGARERPDRRASRAGRRSGWRRAGRSAGCPGLTRDLDADGFVAYRGRAPARGRRHVRAGRERDAWQTRSWRGRPAAPWSASRPARRVGECPGTCRRRGGRGSWTTSRAHPDDGRRDVRARRERAGRPPASVTRRRAGRCSRISTCARPQRLRGLGAAWRRRGLRRLRERLTRRSPTARSSAR